MASDARVRDPCSRLVETMVIRRLATGISDIFLAMEVQLCISSIPFVLASGSGIPVAALLRPAMSCGCRGLPI